MIELIDVSQWQGFIDWPRVATSGINGAIVKCIDGRLPDIDPRFTENWRALSQTSLVRGSYAFARPATDDGGAADGRAEAQDYASTMLAQDPGDDWIAVVDLERGGMDPSHSAQQNIDFLAAWVETCEAELGRSPWIYTGKYTWLERMDWTTLFDHLPLWQASYTSSPPEMPWPLTTLWQYTSEGSVSGIVGRVDRNIFYGTDSELRALAKPIIYSRGGAQAGPIFAPLDLAGSGPADVFVAQVQGLLLALGYGPAGLVDVKTGRPDGKRGPATRDAYARATGSSSTAVDWVRLLTGNKA